MGRTHAGAEEKHEEEGATGRSCYGLTMAPESALPQSTRFFFLFFSSCTFKEGE